MATPGLDDSAEDTFGLLDMNRWLLGVSATKCSKSAIFLMMSTAYNVDQKTAGYHRAGYVHIFLFGLLSYAFLTIVAINFYRYQFVLPAGMDVIFDGSPPRLFLLVYCFLEHMVHAFQGPSTRFRDKEEAPDERQETEDGEEYVSTKPCILHQRGCDETLQASETRRPLWLVSSKQLTMMKLFSQFLAVDSATPLPRKLDGNTSDGIAQGLESVRIEEDQKES